MFLWHFPTPTFGQFATPQFRSVSWQLSNYPVFQICGHIDNFDSATFVRRLLSQQKVSWKLLLKCVLKTALTVDETGSQKLSSHKSYATIAAPGYGACACVTVFFRVRFSHFMIYFMYHSSWPIMITKYLSDDFWPSAWLVMQSAVLARAIPSVCLSVCPFVRPSHSGIVSMWRMKILSAVFSRTIPLVSREVKFIRIFAGDHP